MINFYGIIFLGQSRILSTYHQKSRNQVVEAIATSFQQHIVDKVEQARFFAIPADKTADASKTAQLSLCLRNIREGCN